MGCAGAEGGALGELIGVGFCDGFGKGFGYGEGIGCGEEWDEEEEGVELHIGGRESETECFLEVESARDEDSDVLEKAAGVARISLGFEGPFYVGRVGVWTRRSVGCSHIHSYSIFEFLGWPAARAVDHWMLHGQITIFPAALQ